MIQGSKSLILTLIFFSFYLTDIYSQDKPKLRFPVDYSFSISGNFGELRSTHFHTGIDVKPRGSNVPIRSVAKGYVSRVSIGSGGYGNVLYIDHPELGITSVYAHLERFSDHIGQAVYGFQLANESFTADIPFDPDLIPIAEGEMIGIMGNTGYSFGTHLHFEIRETSTEKPLNPYLFGILPSDDIKPSFLGLALHGLDSQYRKVTDVRIPILSVNTDTIKLTEPIRVGTTDVGLALRMTDKSDGAYNKNGIYSLRMWVDDILSYQYQIDGISFTENRQINGFIDHRVRRREDLSYALCYSLPGNQLSFIDKNLNGVFVIDENQARRVTVEIGDYAGNKRWLKFSVIKSASISSIEESPYVDMIPSGSTKVIDTADMSITFDKNSLYRNLYLQLTIDTLSNGEKRYHIHHEDEPIRKPIAISIKPTVAGDRDPMKAIIVYVTPGGGRISYGGQWQDGRLTTEIRDFGTYNVDYDLTAPTIRPGSYTSRVGKKTSFSFTIKDNYPTRGDDVEEISYKVWIDGNFTVSPFRQLNSTLTIPIENLLTGEHTLKIEARDHSGNISYFYSIFTKS
jgi:hypothetical protein